MTVSKINDFKFDNTKVNSILLPTSFTTQNVMSIVSSEEVINKIEAAKSEMENKVEKIVNFGLDILLHPIIEYSNLSPEEKRHIKQLRLEELYRERDENWGFFRPINEYMIQKDIKELEKQLGVAHRPDTYEKGWKTAAYFSISLIEGMINGGEVVRDVVEFHGTDLMGKAMLATGKIDQNVYDEVMEETVDNISRDYVHESFDYIYEITGLKGNVYAEDTVRSIGNMGGQIGETIALSFIPGYLAGGATSAITVGQALSSSGSANARPIIAGVSGVGSGLQTAFQNDATIEEAKEASYLQGLVESISWGLGQKIGGINPFKGKVSNALFHVGADMVDATSNVFIQPVIQQKYMDKSYGEIFNSNGGFENLGVNLLLTLLFSGAAEGMPNLKKSSNNLDSNLSFEDGNINSSAAITILRGRGFNENEIDNIIKLPSKDLKDFIESGVTAFTFNYPGGLKDYIENFKYRTEIDGIKFVAEDPKKLNKLIDYYNKAKKYGNTFYIDLIKKYYGNEITLTSTDVAGSKYERTSNIINISEKAMTYSWYETFYHEVGHLLDLKNKFNIDYNPLKVINKKDLGKMHKKLETDYNNAKAAAENFSKTAAAKEIIDVEVEAMMDHQYGPDWRQYKDYYKSYMQLLEKYVQDEMPRHYLRQSGFGSVSDIFSALGWRTEGMMGHSRQYFESPNARKEEINANLFELFALDKMDMLRNYFPDKTVNEWEKYVKQILEIEKISMSNKLEFKLKKIMKNGESLSYDDYQNQSYYNTIITVLRQRGFKDEQIKNMFNTWSWKQINDFVASGKTINSIRNSSNTNMYRDQKDLYSKIKGPLGSYTLLSKIVEKLYYNNSAYSALSKMHSVPKTFPTVNECNNFWNMIFSTNNSVHMQEQVGQKVSFVELDRNRLEQRQNNNFIHIKNGPSQTGEKLYLNVNVSDAYNKIIPRFIALCNKQGINYQFKVARYNGTVHNASQFARDEMIVIYSNNQNTYKYVNILNWILDNDSSIEVFPPPILSGVLDGKIGFATDPIKRTESYNGVRAALIEKAYQNTKMEIPSFDINKVYDYIDPDNLRYLRRFYQNIIELCPQYGVNPKNIVFHQ